MTPYIVMKQIENKGEFMMLNEQNLSALELLKKRYVLGEITKEMFSNLTLELLKCDEKFLKMQYSCTNRKKVFYVDVGNLDKVEAEEFLKKIENQYREDTDSIFLPVRGGQPEIRIEIL